MPSSHTLTFSEVSPDAARVVSVHASPDIPASLPADGVLVRMLAFPVNPQDLMQIAGRYPVQPAHRHGSSPIPGNDGVGVVERAGSDVASSLQPGDAVIPKRHGLGTWRSHAVLRAADLLRIPRGVDAVAASLLKMGAAPAFLLLEDMRSLKPGDWVAVNAARGVIPQLVAQFARLRGCRTVAVIRGREDFGAVAEELKQGGADVVVSEEQLAAHGAAADAELAAAVQQQRVVLALDAVFAAAGEALAGLLAPGGTFVNYGSLGGADGVVRLSQELLFWRQVRFRNFRLSQQLAERSDAEQERLLAWFAELLVEGRLRTPVVEEVAFKGGDVAELEGVVRRSLELATKRPIGVKKQVFVL